VRTGLTGQPSKVYFAASVKLTPGTILGQYEIRSPLGAGGMGEVYRARDSRLDREVAIKVLPEFLSSDPERLRRFEQEARATAALNHPNILAVYQMGTYEDVPYLVSELLDGETLREILVRGPLGFRQTIDYGVQIAHGLAAAHEKGIVHRDLKPENLFVTKDGRVKILDFGLAKFTQGPTEAADGHTVTIMDNTSPGLVLGTMGYMSPEQVRAQATDQRSDIFAFGVVLHEMVTGKQTFRKPTAADTMSAILNEEPPSISQFAPDAPLALEKVVHRCLEKKPELRFQSASDMAFALGASSDPALSSATTGHKPENKSPRRLRTAAVAAVLAIGFGAAVLAYFWMRPKVAPKVANSALRSTDTVVLADFINKTGDPIFDDTLKQALSVSLGQSSFLNILSDQKVRSTLKLMGRSPSDPVPVDTALDVCQRTGSAAVFSGSIAGLGSQYVLGLNATDCRSGDMLAQTQEQAARKEDVLKALDQAAAKLREKVGESLGNIQKDNTPLEQATTASLEALKSYSQGRMLHVAGDNAAAIPFQKRAIELDPNFAIAYLDLGFAYQSIGQTEVAEPYMAKAYALRERASDHERFRIETYYFLDIGDMDKARATSKLWEQAYPQDLGSYLALATLEATTGDFDQAIKDIQEALRVAPDAGLIRGTAFQLYISANRPDEAKAIYQELVATTPEDPDLHAARYALAFVMKDQGEMDRQVAWARGKAGAEAMWFAESETEAYYGRNGKARELSRRAIESAKRGGRTETAATWQMSVAMREAALGNNAEAREQAKAALALPSGKGLQILGALVFGRAGDSVQATRMADDLAKRYPQDTLLVHYWLPSIRAAIELDRNNPAEAIDILQTAAPVELGNEGQLYPVQLRGEAFLARHQGNEAAAEFQKILDHRGVVLNNIGGALALLGLGRAYAIQGDAAKARAAYQDFFALWKDADSDIQILRQAKAEFAKLQ
jgi:serine/threonine protein kinase/tetratricopeptide (TPR) repeat protein